MRNKYLSNTLLAGILGIALAVCVLSRTFVPMVVLPALDIPNMVLLSLAALVLEHYLVSGRKGSLLLSSPLAALTFGLLPYAAGLATGTQALKAALLGGIVFALTGWLYRSVQERLSSGPAAKAAPVLSALGLYLAAQCFAGMGL